MTDAERLQNDIDTTTRRLVAAKTEQHRASRTRFDAEWALHRATDAETLAISNVNAQRKTLSELVEMAAKA